MGEKRSIHIDKYIQTAYTTIDCLRICTEDYAKLHCSKFQPTLWSGSNIPQDCSSRICQKVVSTHSLLKSANCRTWYWCTATQRIAIVTWAVLTPVLFQDWHWFQEVLHRIDFACWFLQHSVAQLDFPTCILFTDEDTFSLERVINAHNILGPMRIQVLHERVQLTDSSASMYGYASSGIT